MAKILCATRGGEAAIKNQMAAIQRAKEGGHSLLFFYVVDVEFMAHADYALRSDIVTSEMQKMAEFLMAMAVERAEKQGVPARFIIKHGSFVEELKATIREEAVETVVLGRPGEEESAFLLTQLEKLAETIRREASVETLILG
jgi:nucleotide-binding universal stress UspA family protein